jgi:hypothetical protein
VELRRRDGVQHDGGRRAGDRVAAERALLEEARERSYPVFAVPPAAPSDLLGRSLRQPATIVDLCLA